LGRGEGEGDLLNRADVALFLLLPKGHFLKMGFEKFYFIQLGGKNHRLNPVFFDKESSILSCLRGFGCLDGRRNWFRQGRS
jgi:hypothetical protein